MNQGRGNACPEEVVTECVRYILYCEGSKRPLKVSDIEKHVNKVCQIPHDKNAVLEMAKNHLKQVYGYKLVKLESKGAQYLVVLNDPCESLLSSYTNPKHRQLLIAALIHIFMQGGNVRDTDLWDFLVRAKLMEENCQTTKKLLATVFTKQMYLEYNKLVQNEQQPKFEFRWGQRAEEEFPKTLILNKMAQAFEKSPSYWMVQYRAAGGNANNSQ